MHYTLIRDHKTLFNNDHNHHYLIMIPILYLEAISHGNKLNQRIFMTYALTTMMD